MWLMVYQYNGHHGQTHRITSTQMQSMPSHMDAAHFPTPKEVSRMPVAILEPATDDEQENWEDAEEKCVMAIQIKPNLERNQSYQSPKPDLYSQGSGKPRIWKTRYRRYLPDGASERPWETFGDENEFPTQTALMKSKKWEDFIKRINRRTAVVTLSDLARDYVRDEVKKWVRKSQQSALNSLSYIEEEFGRVHLDKLFEMKYEIKSWLESEGLFLRKFPNKPASRQSRKHMRRQIVAMLTYAVDKRYLPYNPFAGNALTVKRGGAQPVDRSVFHISYEMFQFLQRDPETPDYVKMMQLLAYIAGLRASEFLGLREDDIEIDSSQPQLLVQRSVSGKYVNHNAKTQTSKAPVPIPVELAEALKAFMKKYPPINGWIFGSMETGRPLHLTSLSNCYNRPALLRMGAAFNRKVPKGTGFHSFRHSYNANIKVAAVQHGALSLKEVQAMMMEALRQSDENTNKRYGKSAAPVLELNRTAHERMANLAMRSIN